jgi:DNA-binding beta-propeller fold protein YncE
VGVLEGGEHEMFGQVAGVSFDAEGRLYVLDRGNHRVVVFGPDGRFLRSLGRRGSGPGELQGPVALAVTGDQVAVLDLPDGGLPRWLRRRTGSRSGIGTAGWSAWSSVAWRHVA